MAIDSRDWEAWRLKHAEKTDLTAVEPVLRGSQKHELDWEFDVEHGTGGKHAPFFKFNSAEAAAAQQAYDAWLIVKDVAFRSLEVLGTVDVKEVLIARSASSRTFLLRVPSSETARGPTVPDACSDSLATLPSYLIYFAFVTP